MLPQGLDSIPTIACNHPNPRSKCKARSGQLFVQQFWFSWQGSRECRETLTAKDLNDNFSGMDQRLVALEAAAYGHRCFAPSVQCRSSSLPT
jgi:hypothetical protein